jgi:hypothetical protein
VRLIGLLWLLSTVAVSSALGGDLYLLSIGNHNDVATVNDVVGYAHGRIDGRFLVELDNLQVEKLKSAGISLELIAMDFKGAQFSLVSPKSADFPKTSLFLNPVFSDGISNLIKGTPADYDVLRRSGYMVIPLDQLKTPFFYASQTVAFFPRDEYPSDSLADLINQDSLYSFDSTLEAFYTRYIYSDSVDRARDWLVAKFLEFGYTQVTYDTFYYNEHPCHNVICYKPGTVEQDRLIVIGGHYDSFNTQSDPILFAPGADDNGSGAAATLELARILKDVETRKSFLFVAFSAEEVGLVGSFALADRLFNQGADVELMVNFDMVAYTDDAVNDVTFYSGSIKQTVDVFFDACYRVSTLIPYFAGSANNSDHASFNHFGYPVVFVQEGDFNYPGWHTNIDLCSRLDFPYFSELMQMSAAAIGYVDHAAHSTRIENIRDVGDGQSLRVTWLGCDVSYSYKILYGVQSGVYTDTIAVPPGDCFYDIGGLTTGVEYFIAVLGISPEGYGPLYLTESSGTPYLLPRAPSDLTADLDYQKIILIWQSNQELDLNHYRLLRRPVGGNWQVLADDLIDTTYDDISAEPHVEYEYSALAVDDDGYESDSSTVVKAVIPTFDLPLLFVEETSEGGVASPSEAQQEAFYDSVFGLFPYDKYPYDSNGPPERFLAGQYGSLAWLDDDLHEHDLYYSLDMIRWYLNYTTNFLIAGWETIYWVTGTNPLTPGDLFYDEFGISRVRHNASFDFIGAAGAAGWPDLETRTDNIFGGLLPSISIFETLPAAEVIYTYISNSSDPNFNGKPVGVLYDSGKGKRIALSFPIYQLTEPSAEALMAKILTEFGLEPLAAGGDANGDGLVNIKDIIFIICYVLKGGAAPEDLNVIDVNADCIINIEDIYFLINFVYLDGPVPKYGCVE